MNKNSFSFGVIGYPLAHSLSPRIHSAALRALALEGEYRLYVIPPLPVGAERLESLLGEMRRGEIDGLNVTIPHKQSVLSIMDVLTDTARNIGAVNTIIRRKSALIGDNTDAPGFMNDLERYLPQALYGKWALVLGAGGAARAVVYALLGDDWHVRVAARRLDQAVKLVDEFQERGLSAQGAVAATSISALGGEDFKRWITSRGRDFGLVVNATPVGMSPHKEGSPWPQGAPLPQHGMAYDLVYNPQETSFLRQARLAGLRTANGLGMLVEQAALAFERWTGIRAPRDIMAEAAQQVNGTSDSPSGTNGTEAA